MAIQQIGAQTAGVMTIAANRPIVANGAGNQPSSKVQPTTEQLKLAVQEVKQAIEPMARDLKFSIDRDMGRTIVKVVDGATNEVIRQIPSEELLAVSRAIDKLQGLLLKQKA